MKAREFASGVPNSKVAQVEGPETQMRGKLL